MAYMLDHWHRAYVSDSRAESRNHAVWALLGISDVNDTNRRAAPDPVSSFSVCHAPLRPLVVDRSVYCDKDMFLLCLRLQINFNRFSNGKATFLNYLKAGLTVRVHVPSATQIAAHLAHRQMTVKVG